MKQLLLVCGFSVVMPLHAACQAGHYQISTVGVLDRDSGLVWARCSLGQSGSQCNGKAKQVNLADAQQWAQSQPGWRLPTHDELMSLVQSNCSSTHLNSTAFPNAPEGAVWSATLSADVNGNGYWAVDLREGFDDIVNRSNVRAVRLVRKAK